MNTIPVPGHNDEGKHILKRLSVSIACSAALLLVLAGCKQDDTNPSNNTGNINNNPGDMQITGVSPERPYIDDIITITGNGFSDDDTANHVRLQRLESGTKDLEIISATPTEIRARVPAEDSSNYLPSGWKDRVVVSRGTRSFTYDKDIWWRAPLRIMSIVTHGAFVWNGFTPGEQAEVEVRGVVPSAGASLSLANAGPLTVDSIADYDEYRQICTLYVSSQPNLMRPAPVPWPESLCDSTYTARDLTLRSNGRSYTKPAGVHYVPVSQFHTIEPASISIEDLNNVSQGGGQIFIHLKGKNLYGAARLLHGDSPEQVIGTYRDDFGFQIGGLGWKVLGRGSYQVVIQQRECDGIPGMLYGTTFYVH